MNDRGKSAPNLESVQLVSGFEIAGLWVPLVVPLGFLCFNMETTSMLPIFLAAFGAGSLLTTAGLLSLSFLTSAQRTVAVAAIFCFVVVMAVGEGDILSKSALPGALQPKCLFCHETAPIWVTILIYALIASLRTIVLRKSGSFDEQS